MTGKSGSDIFADTSQISPGLKRQTPQALVFRTCTDNIAVARNLDLHNAVGELQLTYFALHHCALHCMAAQADGAAVAQDDILDNVEQGGVHFAVKLRVTSSVKSRL